MSKVDTIYLIHHSHTDIGYTHDQPIVWDLHGRFIEEGLRLADQYVGSDSDGAFRWTVENTAVLYEWLQHADPQKVRRFQELEQAGRIEVTGMFANLTPLLDTDELIESLQLVGKLRTQYGFKITHAMNCDVNGESWSLPDLLLDLGIEGFTMAINIHFGGAPLNRPNVFWWRGPSGRKILAYSSWAYDMGWKIGLGRTQEDFKEWWARVDQRLDEVNYPLPVLMFQSFHPFGDNGPAYERFSTFIDEWNAKGERPHIVFGTPALWWQAVKPFAPQLPTYAGDWTDFWNFGCASSARETAINRGSRNRLRTADALASALLSPSEPLPSAHAGRVLDRYRAQAWKALILYDEHTWGADYSVRTPESEDTASQWYHKAAYAYQARSLSLMLQRDALADFSRYVSCQRVDDLLVFNPLPWSRMISGEVPHHVANPRGLTDDATAGRHSQDRVWPSDAWSSAAQRPDGVLPEVLERLALLPVEVPGYGYAVVSRSELIAVKPESWNEQPVIENAQFRLQVDPHKGGVISLFDKPLHKEWVDASAGYPLNGFVFEEVADHQHPWPRILMFRADWGSSQVEMPRGWRSDWRASRAAPSQVLSHRTYRAPDGWRTIQTLEAPGVVGPLVQSTFLPDEGGYVEFESWWVMGQSPHPEATYLVFPFNVPGAQARIDLGGQAMLAGQDQSPGVCYDYYTAQAWADLSNQDFGVTVALPDNPMVQFGDFHFGHNQPVFNLERAMLLGWVTNTYWETNFRAHQPGEVHARYRVYPHAAGFDPLAAHRWGQETAYSQPLMQHLGEPPAPVRFAQTGQLLRLPEDLTPGLPVFTLHVKPLQQGSGLAVRLYNAADSDREAQIASGQLRITSAQLGDLTENPLQALPVQDGALTVNLPSRRVVTLLLSVQAPDVGEGGS
jgi:alpha-mannosidase